MVANLVGDLLEAAPSWTDLQERFPALDGVEVSCTPRPQREIPFVHESDEADYIRGFRRRNELRRFVEGKQSEYEAMLALAAWIGTRFDHGTDRPFDGR